jgi:hypothetical protein
MPTTNAKERIERQLQEAIDRLRADLVRVEMWACALNDFSRPVPDYQPSDDLTRHLLPHPSKRRNITGRGERSAAAQPADPRGERKRDCA